MLKVLILNNRIPFPLKDGGAVASHHLITQLLEETDVELDLFFLNTQKHYLEDFKAREIYRAAKNIIIHDVDTSTKPLGALKALALNESYNISRFLDKGALSKLRVLLEQSSYDIIHFENLFMTPYLGLTEKLSNAKRVLRMHNVEHQIWEKLHANSSGLKKWYLKILARQLKDYEVHALKKFNAFIPISEEDNQWLQKRTTSPSEVIPTGIEIDEGITYNPGKKFFHIGSMEWKPNYNACKNLVFNIWPKVMKADPTCELHLAGRAMVSGFESWQGKGVFLHGEVESAKEFMLQNNCMIIPLESASGLRIKAIEAMALKRPILSTKIGMSGTRAKKDKHFVESTNSSMAEDIVRVANDLELQKSFSENSFQFVKRNFGKEELSNKLIKFYKSL